MAIIEVLTMWICGLKTIWKTGKFFEGPFLELEYGDYETLESMQFIPGWTNFNVGNGIEVDIMTDMKGVDLSFDECYQLAPKADIEGVVVPFLHINHLIDNKKAVNDQIDVENLEKIKAMRKGDSDE